VKKGKMFPTLLSTKGKGGTFLLDTSQKKDTPSPFGGDSSLSPKRKGGRKDRNEDLGTPPQEFPEKKKKYFP